MQNKDIYLVLWILFLIGLIVSLVFMFYVYEDSIYPKISTGVCGFFFIIFLIIYIVFDQEKYNQLVKKNAEADEEAKKYKSTYYGKARNTDVQTASLLYPGRRFVSMDDKLKWYYGDYGGDPYVNSRKTTVDRLLSDYRKTNDPNKRERINRQLDNYLENLNDMTRYRTSNDPDERERIRLNSQLPGYVFDRLPSSNETIN